MKLGIMQPYVFPYIGYFQLINAVDSFVILDDVQWIKHGWINRNRILVQGKPQHLTLPLQKDSLLLNINQRQLSVEFQKQKAKVFRQIESAYRKAPYFTSVMDIIVECFGSQERNVCAFVVNSLRACCNYIGIETPFILSSQLEKRNELHGQDRILEINAVMEASHYINPIGGTDLYNKERFAEKGLKLSFLKTRNVAYDQLWNREFVPSLSIIDVMMFNSKDELSDLLKEYDLH